jgi:hypothetical protein
MIHDAGHPEKKASKGAPLRHRYLTIELDLGNGAEEKGGKDPC